MAVEKIGIALGSGAVRGYAIIPIIKKLEKEGIEITAVSGSSIGALIGAYYALNGEVDSFLEIARSLPKKDYFKLVDLNNPRVSLIKGKKIKNFIAEKYFGDKTFKDTKIPLFVCVTDPVEKKSVYITKGKLIDAVMASISIPGIFPPYSIGNKMYLDGGVLDPVPAKPLLEKGFEKIIGVNLTRYKRGEKKKQDKSLLSVLMNSFYMMMEQLAEETDTERLYMLNPRFEPDSIRMLAFYEWEKNYMIGQGLINRKFKDLKQWLTS